MFHYNLHVFYLMKRPCALQNNIYTFTCDSDKGMSSKDMLELG